MFYPYRQLKKKKFQNIDNSVISKYKCSYCNRVIESTNTIYFAYDNTFCSDKCRDKFIPSSKFNDIYISNEEINI